MMKKEVTHAALFCGLICLIGIFYVVTLRPGQNWGGDFSMYIQHAKNIVHGNSYAYGKYIPNKYDFTYPREYQPGFPLILSLLYRYQGMNLHVMKTAETGFFLLSLITVYIFFRSQIPFRYLLAIIALLGLQPCFWDFKENVMSDFPFLFMCLLTLYFIQLCFDLPVRRVRRFFFVILTGFLIYSSYLTRKAGLVLIPTVFLYDLLKNKRITVAASMILFLFIVFFSIQGCYYPPDLSFFNNICVDFPSLRLNIREIILQLCYFWTYRYLGLFLILMTIPGFLHRWRTNPTVLEPFTVIYLAALAIWPTYHPTRYFFPLFPLFLLYLFTSIRMIVQHFQLQHETAIIAALLIIFTGAYFMRYKNLDFREIKRGIHTPESVGLFEFVFTHTTESDVFIFKKPRVFSLITDRPATQADHVVNADEFFDFVRFIHAKYVIVGKDFVPNEQNLRTIISSCNDCFEKEFSNAGFQVYRILCAP